MVLFGSCPALRLIRAPFRLLQLDFKIPDEICRPAQFRSHGFAPTVLLGTGPDRKSFFLISRAAITAQDRASSSGVPSWAARVKSASIRAIMSAMADTMRRTWRTVKTKKAFDPDKDPGLRLGG